jgi:predicted TIM-barrel fold metal-dependent hydrolase
MMLKEREFTGNMHRRLADLSAWHALRAEQPIEPDLPIVDSHHHLWEDHRGTYLLRDYLDDIRGLNVRSTVCVEASTMYRTDGPEELRSLGETEFTTKQAAASIGNSHGAPRVAAAIVGFADLTLGDDVGPILDRHIAAADGRFRGVRHATVWDGSAIGNHAYRGSPPGLLRDARFQAGIRQLSNRGLIFDAFVFHPQIDDVVHAARHNPDATIVLNHVGCLLGVGPYTNNGSQHFDVWRSKMATLAQCENVFVKVGGMGMLLFGHSFHEQGLPPSSDDLVEQWRRPFEACIELFGPSRCMLESNFPVDKQSCGYVTLWNAFKKLTAAYSADERESLFSATAETVYRLTVPLANDRAT